MSAFEFNRRTRLWLGSSALALAAAMSVSAQAATFNVGGGTIVTTQADNSVDNTGTGGGFELQANTVASGDSINVSNVSISANNPAHALDIGNVLSSTGSYSVSMHGATLSGGAGAWIQTTGGLVSFDTTGGSANVISADIGLTVINITGGGGAAVNLGADSITSTTAAVSLGGGNGSIS